MRPAALRQAVRTERLTAAALARRYDVCRDTAARWLADAGALDADPVLTSDVLRTLYVDEGASVREIATRFGVGKNRVLRALSVAGVQTRPRAKSLPIRLATVSAHQLHDAYVVQRMTIGQVSTHLGISVYQVRRDISRLGLGKRRGSHTPRSAYGPAQLRQFAAERYLAGESISEIAADLGVSNATVSQALHASQLAVDPAGRSRAAHAGSVIGDLYADPDVLAALRRHDVSIAGEAWIPGSPWQTYASEPLDAELVRELYEHLGLSIAHIAMLCGVGQVAVRSRMIKVGIAKRPPSQRAPWTMRRPSLDEQRSS